MLAAHIESELQTSEWSRCAVYDEAGNVIETHEHTGDFKEWRAFY